MFPPLPPVVLGSGSARRRELMTHAGIPFRVARADLDEIPPEGLALADIPVALAQQKADWLLHHQQVDLTTELLITADTVVVLGDTLYGKPAKLPAAIEMLLTLQGRTHIVYTGVVVQWQDNSLRFTEAAEVRFRPLSPRFIEAYVHQHPPLDRAGAYGIQDAFGLRAISSIVGDYYTVVGLPVCRLLAELERHFQLPLP